MICFNVRQMPGWGVFALMAAVIMLSLTMPAAAAEDVADETAVIRSIPGERYEMNNDFSRDAEDYYDFIGLVDDVQEEGMIVGDTYMKFAPNAKVSGAGIGREVGIVFNSRREAVIVEPYKKSN